MKKLARQRAKAIDPVGELSGLVQLAYEAVTAAYEEQWEALPELIERADLIADVTPAQIVLLVPSQQQDVFCARDIAETLRKALAAAARDDVAMAKQWAYCYTYSLLVEQKQRSPLFSKTYRLVSSETGQVFLTFSLTQDPMGGETYVGRH